MKSKTATVSLHARVGIAIFCVSFAKANNLYIMINEQNNSLRVSIGPSITFHLHRVTRTESEHKHLATEQLPYDLLDDGPPDKTYDKTSSDDSLSSSFRKSAIATWPCSN